MFRFIYLPLIIITLIYIALYSAIYYLVFIYFGGSGVLVEAATWICPFLLSAVPVALWIFPRVKKLKGPGDGSPRLELSRGIEAGPPPISDNLRYMLCAVACGIMGLSTVTAIWTLQMVSLGLTPISNVSDIYHHPKAKYFTIQHLSIDTSRSGISYYTMTTGRGNFNYMRCFIASPLVSNNDSITGKTIWIGNMMESELAKNITELQAQEKLKEHEQSSWNAWKKMLDNKSFNYLEKFDDKFLYDDLLYAIGVAGYHYKGPVILKPHFGSFEGEIKFRVRILLLIMIGGLLFWWLITSGFRVG